MMASKEEELQAIVDEMSTMLRDFVFNMELKVRDFARVRDRCYELRTPLPTTDEILARWRAEGAQPAELDR